MRLHEVRHAALHHVLQKTAGAAPNGSAARQVALHVDTPTRSRCFNVRGLEGLFLGVHRYLFFFLFLNFGVNKLEFLQLVLLRGTPKLPLYYLHKIVVH